jgi:glycosyltransferase involved in cell wall biosynthesis
MDGGSTDGSYELALEYQRQLQTGEFKINCNALTLIVYQESDSGMYDALANGFSQVTGDIVCYLNADDLFSPGAFEAVSKVFDSKPDVNWLTGIPQSLRPDGTVYYNKMPGPYRSSLIKQGFYGPVLPFIQQESTFWRSNLLQALNFEDLRKCQMAGDFLIWKSFATKYKLWMLDQYLSGARIHPDRMSGDLKEYFREQKSLADAKTINGRLLSFFDSIFWRLLPTGLQKKLMSGNLIR